MLLHAQQEAEKQKSNQLECLTAHGSIFGTPLQYAKWAMGDQKIKMKIINHYAEWQNVAPKIKNNIHYTEWAMGTRK